MTKESKTVRVTYRPLSADERSETTWNGVRFIANIPVELDPAKHFIELATMPGAPKQTLSMIDIAKCNPSFEVEGFPRAKHIVPKGKVPQPGVDWVGTDRAELITQMAQVTDFDPNADAIMIR